MLVGQHYLDRNALYHLGEVAGGIVRRQQAELGTGGREQAVDVALYRLIVEGVEDQGGALALVHALDLGFLEIGLDPQIPVRYQGQQMRAGLHVLPRADAALSDPTCHRGANLGAGEVDLRSEEHTSELQSRPHLVCRLLLEKKKYTTPSRSPH